MVTSRWGIAEPIRSEWQTAEFQGLGGAGKDKEDEIKMGGQRRKRK